MDIEGRLDPLDRIEWKAARHLDGNSWNPNMVLTPELKLLELSLLTSGWIQPILVSAGNIIIDGYHRWRLATESAPVMERWGGRVPCVVMELTRPEAMMLTVRINRAKGVHASVRMHELVAELVVKHGIPREEVAAGIGATLDEVKLLEQEGVFAQRNIAAYRYSKAWVPQETGTRTKDEWVESLPKEDHAAPGAPAEP